MKRSESIPSDYPVFGVFVATLLEENPTAIQQTFSELQATEQPVDELPIDSPELVRQFTHWMADRHPEGEDFTGRRMVVWRGLYAALHTLHYTPKTLWPRLREVPEISSADMDDRFLPLVRQATQGAFNFPDIYRAADVYRPYTDPSGYFPLMAEIGVLAGFAMLEHGEREIQRDIEQSQARAEQEIAAVQARQDEIAMLEHMWDVA